MNLLLEHKTKVDALDEHQRTPLFRAVERGYAETANMLIQAGAAVNHRDGELRTPLHWAALYGHLPVLSLLLANGANYVHADQYGKTAIHCGAYNGHNEVVKYLIESGTNLNAKGSLWCMNQNLICVDRDNLTALHWAALRNHPHTVELLLLEGASPNPTDTYLLEPTPMDFARNLQNIACIAILSQYDGKTVLEMQNQMATRIQKIWRGHYVRKFFKAFRSDRKNNHQVLKRSEKESSIEDRKKSDPEALGGIESPWALTMDSDELNYLSMISQKKTDEDFSAVKFEGVASHGYELRRKTLVCDINKQQYMVSWFLDPRRVSFNYCLG